MILQGTKSIAIVSIRKMKSTLPILFLLAFVKVSVSDASVDPSAWTSYYVTESHEHADAVDVVDPSGWNYDRETKSSVRGLKTEDKEKQVLTFCKRVLEKNDIETNPLVENEMDVAVKSKVETLVSRESTGSENIAFVKRFVSILLNSAELTERYMEGRPDVTGIVEIRVSAEHLKRLAQFSNSTVNISMRELDSILTASIHRKHIPVFDIFELIDKIFFMASQKEVWLPVVLVSIMFCVLRLLLRSKTTAGFVTSFLILILIVSYFVEYYRMYKEVEIRQKVILDNNPDIPSSCNPTWWSALLSSLYFHKESECEKYHKAVLLDPFVEVSPSRVLSNILSDLILQPFGKIGTAVAAFSTAIFDGLPFHLSWIVWMFSSGAIFILICFGVVMLIGGSIQWQGLFSGVSISGRQTPQIPSTAAPKVSAPPPSTSATQPLLDTVSGISNFVLMDANSLRTLMQRAQTGVAVHHSGVQDLVDPLEDKSPSSQCNEKIDLTELQKNRACTEKDKSVVITESYIKKEIKREDISSEVGKEVNISDSPNAKEELLVTFEVIQSDATCSPVDVTLSESECEREQLDNDCCES